MIAIKYWMCYNLIKTYKSYYKTPFYIVYKGDVYTGSVYKGIE